MPVPLTLSVVAPLMAGAFRSVFAPPLLVPPVGARKMAGPFVSVTMLRLMRTL